jgi:hypothetical protein
LPTLYENLTDLDWTFYFIVIRDDLPFNLPGELLSATLHSAFVLPAGKSASISGLGYTLPLTTRTGNGRLSYWMFANHIGAGGSTILTVAKCDYDLTVQPLFFAPKKGSADRH